MITDAEPMNLRHKERIFVTFLFSDIFSSNIRYGAEFSVMKTKRPGPWSHCDRSRAMYFLLNCARVQGLEAVITGRKRHAKDIIESCQADK
jgi:hypothetical protein